jgi:hypothetical protein
MGPFCFSPGEIELCSPQGCVRQIGKADLDARSAPQRGDERSEESISPGAPNDKGSPTGALFHFEGPG